MNVLLAGRFDSAEREHWLAALRAALPEARWHLDPDPSVEVAVVANPAPGALAGLPRLGFIQSLWAGVDRLLADPTLPPQLPLARMVDPMMTAAMAETALWATIALQRGFFRYQQQQHEGLWCEHRQRRAEAVPVVLLGAGEMGRAVAARLAPLGYPVTLWRRDGTPLAAALEARAVVINLLPLTDATRGLLNRSAFGALARGAGLVNLGRGGHVVDEDLLAALDDGQLGHAVLDVFQVEPLPREHRFWTHPKVTLLPHVAALTDHASAAQVVAANLRAWRDGKPVAHRVDRGRGY